ncbi:thioredoxin-like protein [Purpureocillium lilacinum]|uniref:Thioredoxin-like protein n=1 Tax=Purpureocillium lilacinum TaxID=33203 RepID=A0A179GZF5_PURLI|nr:thioredoxin-like protein [Purpureocillium lilacinum]OAQ82640.1 thioredoxin-like protein [Purpureocillium lilacinum]
MASEQITLFDLRSKGPNHAWSLNPWKTRLLLNYKGLDYKTEWLNYPEIKPTLEAHVPPNAEGYPYSIPTVAFPDGTWIMESRAIATAIEERHPSPPAHLSSPYQSRIEALVPAAMKALLPIFYANVPRRLLEPASLEYWYRVRGEKVGMPIDEFEAKHGGEAAYAAAEQPLRDVTAMYKESGGEGPFLQGAEVCYADFVWIAFLEFARRIGEDVYEGVLQRTGDRAVHEKLMQAAAPWLKRNDH